jgi:glycosyltransferase involved in cell wall biosynthesis
LGYGLPIVATNVGGTPDRVRDGQNGFLIEAGDVPTLAAALTRLCREPSLRSAFGISSRELSQMHFTWQAVGEKIGEVIRGALAKS